MRLRAIGATVAGLSDAKGGLTQKEASMVKRELRRAVIREWMALTREKRQSPQQALAFAKAALQRHSLPRNRRAPHEIIMGWLRPRTGRP
jgi:hypothetical protein